LTRRRHESFQPVPASSLKGDAVVIVRNVFTVKFGKARDAMEAYKEVVGIARQPTGVPIRVLTDVTGQNYTIVSELAFENLAAFESTMPKISGDARWQAAYQKFTPNVDSGYREILRVVD
jgi:hypothetical protein